jgi:hypothetical protein
MMAGSFIQKIEAAGMSDWETHALRCNFIFKL